MLALLASAWLSCMSFVWCIPTFCIWLTITCVGLRLDLQRPAKPNNTKWIALSTAGAGLIVIVTVIGMVFVYTHVFPVLLIGHPLSQVFGTWGAHILLPPRQDPLLSHRTRGIHLRTLSMYPPLSTFHHSLIPFPTDWKC